MKRAIVLLLVMSATPAQVMLGADAINLRAGTITNEQDKCG